MKQPAFTNVEDAFVYCRDMDASLNERLDIFSEASRALRPEGQEAIDHMVERLSAYEAGALAPGPGDIMPPFALPDETGRVVTLDSLLAKGPVAVTFHRGHWCPYCRINTRVLADVHERIIAEGASLVAILPEREQFAAGLSAEAKLHYPILCDLDNGYALSINLAIYVGAELQEMMTASGYDLPRYQGNNAWLLPIPATFVIGQDGRVVERFIDPDYRKRMAEDDLLAALRNVGRQAAD
ncbi:MAG: peroxiredoxin-like family protein [Hyphomicrobiaceae bacterium]|jgi:peroxiredoxin|nr:peroxiredoxin-like family protein [Hyphomicrobiaceae bacterium]MDX2449370.1 peroxiredoxin-like family protein [Hyphomicrobiaceae bacterium]